MFHVARNENLRVNQFGQFASTSYQLHPLGVVHTFGTEPSGMLFGKGSSQRLSQPSVWKLETVKNF